MSLFSCGFLFIYKLARLLIHGLVLVGMFGAASSQAELTVLASIKPLALIAQEVVGDRARVDILLPIKASPHDYPLRISDMRRLQAADIVLWIGPELESFLRRPLHNIPLEKRLASYDLAGLHWPGLSHQGQEPGEHSHQQDPHLWLDPRNAVVIARELAIKLGEIDRGFAAEYQANAQQFAAAVSTLDQRLLAKLKPVTGRGFAVYHEGYLHFVGRYGLKQLAYVTLTPERRPGAKHLYELRNTLKNKGYCLFIEPFYDERVARDLAHELELQLAIIDPIGGDKVNSYQQLIEQMAQAFLSCLANTSGLGKL